MDSSSARAHERFVDRVRVSELSTRWDWRLPEWVALAAIPTIFLVGWLAETLTENTSVVAVLDTSLRIVIFVVLAVANRRVLASDWAAFRRGGWRSWLLVIAGMIAIQLVITAVRALQLATGTGGVSQESDATPTVAFGIILFASLAPTVTALIEDFTFRHTLLVRLPVWRYAAVGAVVTVANALVFGSIHLNNFGGNWLGTLPYAAAGLLMNLVYLWTRNIWTVLLMHGLNNFLLGGPLLVAFVHLMGAM